MLPARGAVDADVREELAALGGRVPAEAGVGPAGEEGPAEGEQFLADRGDLFHQGGVQALQDVRVGPQGEFAEALQLPGELLVPRALHVRGGLLEPPEQRRRGEVDTAQVGVARLRRQSERPGAHHAPVDRVVPYQRQIVHLGSVGA